MKFSQQGTPTSRAPLRNKEPRPPTAEEKICCRSKCSCCCSRVRSSAKSNSSFLFSLSLSWSSIAAGSSLSFSSTLEKRERGLSITALWREKEEKEAIADALASFFCSFYAPQDTYSLLQVLKRAAAEKIYSAELHRSFAGGGGALCAGFASSAGALAAAEELKPAQRSCDQLQ